MFHSTLPLGTPDLMRASEFRRYLREAGRDRLASAPGTRPGGLSESLLQDLARFELPGRHGDLLEVLAACMRHTESLAIHLAWGEQVLTLTAYPTQRLIHCPVPVEDVFTAQQPVFEVLQVEPATLRPPGDPNTALVGEPAHYRPLAPVLWTIALHAAREELLPEISGQVAYRVVPGLALPGLKMNSAAARCIGHLRRQSSNLREICAQPGIDRSRAIRLLNALYLQSGLIVSRTHPAATNEGWFGYR